MWIRLPYRRVPIQNLFIDLEFVINKINGNDMKMDEISDALK